MKELVEKQARAGNEHVMEAMGAEGLDPSGGFADRKYMPLDNQDLSKPVINPNYPPPYTPTVQPGATNMPYPVNQPMPMYPTMPVPMGNPPPYVATVVNEKQ